MRPLTSRRHRSLPMRRYIPQTASPIAFADRPWRYYCTVRVPDYSRYGTVSMPGIVQSTVLDKSLIRRIRMMRQSATRITSRVSRPPSLLELRSCLTFGKGMKWTLLGLSFRLHAYAYQPPSLIVPSCPRLPTMATTDQAQAPGPEGQPGAKRLTPITLDEREIPVGARQQCVYESV